MLTVKALSILIATYLKDCLLPHQPIKSYSGALFWVPSSSQARQVATHEKGFLVMMLKVWNSLPKVIVLHYHCRFLSDEFSLFCFGILLMNTLLSFSFTCDVTCVLLLKLIFIVFLTVCCIEEGGIKMF